MLRLSHFANQEGMEHAFPALAIMAVADDARSARSDRAWVAPQ